MCKLRPQTRIRCWYGLFLEEPGFGGMPGVTPTVPGTEIPGLLLIDPELPTHIPEYLEYVLDEQVIPNLLLAHSHIQVFEFLQPALHPLELVLAGLQFVLLLIQNPVVLLDLYGEFVVVLLEEFLETADLEL